MKTDTCGQRLNKQDSNARASNIFVHFSDIRARIRREILSSDVLRRWRDFFLLHSYYGTLPKLHFLRLII